MLKRESERLERLNSFSGLIRWRNALIGVNSLQNGAYGCALGSMASELADTGEQARIRLAELFRAWEELLASGCRPSSPSCHDGIMASQRFYAVITAGPGDSAVVMMPFDPDQAWGAKADHPVSGTIGGCRVRTRLVPAEGGWALILAPKRLTSMGIAIGDEVAVELAPEGPQRGDLADDIAAALAADPAAGAFFDTLAQFYRKAYLRWIDSTTRRPDLRAARIAEVAGLLAAGVKERPRS